MKKVYAFVLLIVLPSLFGSVQIILAQNPDHLKFTHLTTDDGLSQSNVYAIVQDRLGFMWFATRDGLNRYDGNIFVVYKNNPDDSESLSANFVLDLLEDDQGYLWVGTYNGGVNKFNPVTERFTRYRHNPDNPNSLSGDMVKCMLQDSHGNLWFGGETGLDKFDPATETFTRYRNAGDGLSVGTINSIIEDNQRDIWFTGTEGLFSMKQHTGQITRLPKTIAADYLYKDQDGNLWMLAWSPVVGLIKYDRQTQQFTEYPVGTGAVGLASSNLLDDGKHGFWVASSLGLYYFDRRTERFTHRFHKDETNPDGLNDNHVVSIYQDRSGLLWVGTESGGLNLLNFQQEQFGTYRHDPANTNSLASGRVSAICQDPDGIVWVGYTPRALDRFDRSKGQITHYVPDPESDNTIGKGGNLNSIYKDTRGYVWLGGWGASLVRFDERSGQFKHYRPDPDDPNSLINYVLDIHEDRSGNLWVGQFGGISRFDPATEQFTNYTPDPDDPTSLKSGSVRVICQDHSGILWMGTWEGVLSYFNDKTNTFVNYVPDLHDPNQLNGGCIYTIHEDRNRTLWVGGSDGLYRFDRENETFTRYTESQGLSSSNIQGILEDGTGRLWLSTRKGLSRFDPQTETFRNYDASDGLQGNDFSESCYAQGLQGEMFFGGSKGFNAFFPENVRDNPYVPPVVVTDFKIFNKPVLIGTNSVLRQSIPFVDALTLSYSDNVFSFEFAALSYANSAKNRYRYKLEYLEPDWNEVGSTHRVAIYTNLDPGNYVFRVQASNSDGVWNDRGVSMPITITPPWWGTWWFRGAVAVVLLALAIAGYLWRIRSIQQRSRVLEGQVAARTRELAKSNQQLQLSKEAAETAKEAAVTANKAKSVFLANMSHELRTPLNGILGYADILTRRAGDERPLTEGLDIIRKSGEHLLTLINDVLDLARIEAGKLELHPTVFHLPLFLRQITGIMSARAEAKSLSLRYEELSPLPDRILADETRLRQVLLNLLGNAVKFTDRGHVSLTVKVLDTTEPEPGEPQATVCFSVEDTGIGLAPDQLEGIFNSFEQMHAVDRREEGAGLGLAISRQIVQLMGSQLRVQSVVGQGSTFWFDTALPIATITEPEQPTLPVRRITGYEGARRMVLVVDDKLYNRLVVRDLLEPLGFVVHTVEDGQQAVQKAVELRPDAIIMDLVMPVKTGIEAVREIRETPDLKDVPTIAMSASVLKAEQEQSRVAGCNAFLPKPINTEQLLDLLSEHLKLSWIYAGPEVPADTILTPLPRDMLAELNEMARKGDILQIQKHALHLEKMDIAYLPFVHKLQKLAQGFEIDKIKEFIHNWIEEKHDEHE